MAASIILSDNGVSSGTSGIKPTGGNDGTLQLQTTTSGGTPTTALTISNTQNVGINATPAAWGSTFKALQITSASLSSDTAGFNLTQNCYYDGTDWRYLANGAATLYSQGGGQHIFYHATSGTAGATISWNQDVVINTSGHLILAASGSLDLNILNTYSSSSPVYQKLPSGLIIQSGSTVFNAYSGSVTYPVAFTSTVWPVVCNGETAVTSATHGVTNTTTSGFTITSTANTLQRSNWIAFGY